MRPGDTPVPIPNTMVKTRTADGTALETVWESRWPPDYERKDELRLGSSKEERNDWEAEPPRKVFNHKYRQGWATTYQRQPGQQGSAVVITGFTSD